MEADKNILHSLVAGQIYLLRHGDGRPHCVHAVDVRCRPVQHVAVVELTVEEVDRHLGTGASDLVRVHC